MTALHPFSPCVLGTFLLLLLLVCQMEAFVVTKNVQRSQTSAVLLLPSSSDVDSTETTTQIAASPTSQFQSIDEETQDNDQGSLASQDKNSTLSSSSSSGLIFSAAEYGQWKEQKKEEEGEGGGGGESGGIGGFDFKSVFQNLKESITGMVDTDKIKEQVESIFGKGSSLANKLSSSVSSSGEQGKQKVLEFLDKILGEEE